jgi:hypothetical protein
MESDVVGLKSGYDYSRLDKYGLIREGTEVDDKTVLIGLVNNSDGKKVDASKMPKKGQLGIVDKTFMTEGDEGERIAKVRIREVRIPDQGDKMASRAGQKGTGGLIIKECDMPFTKEGIRPDLIINPHAIPSRMTLGHLIECIMAKVCAMLGGFGDCTPFINKGTKIGVFGETLTHMGYHSSGNEILYNGMTGEQLESEIFIGPTYYMRLKHMVKDKINYRARGPMTALTKQPVSGRANDGGLRIGEMERDSIASHGMVDFLTESMMERGDKYKIAVCNTTGLFAIYNPAKNLFLSPMADGPIRFVGSLDGKEMNIENTTHFGRDFSIISVPYSLKLLIQELQAINVQMRIITEDNIDQMESMASSRNLENITGLSDLNEIKKSLVKLSKRDYNEEFNVENGEEVSPELPVGFKPTTPDFATPDYGNKNEVAGWDDSPLYEPKTPEYAPDTSPLYEPKTPEYAPDTSPLYEPKTPEYAPDTSPKDDSPAYAPEYEENYEENYKKRMAEDYKMDDLVNYRGSTNPQQKWKIIKIGANLITLQSTGEDKEIKIVTKLDIYKGPIEGGLSYQPIPVPQPQPAQSYPPGLNYNPVIYIGTQQEPIITTGGGVNDTVVSGEPPPESAPPVAGGSSDAVAANFGEVDFNHLVIRKV